LCINLQTATQKRWRDVPPGGNPLSKQEILNTKINVTKAKKYTLSILATLRFLRFKIILKNDFNSAFLSKKHV
jgi:hypothetical protein